MLHSDYKCIVNKCAYFFICAFLINSISCPNFGVIDEDMEDTNVPNHHYRYLFGYVLTYCMVPLSMQLKIELLHLKTFLRNSYISVCDHTHTHTHTHIYIYIERERL
jgi:hypothetical protein